MGARALEQGGRKVAAAQEKSESDESERKKTRGMGST
jgi:hypothetical protein